MAINQGWLIRIAIPRLGEVRTAVVGFIASIVAFVGIAFASTTTEVYLWCFMSAFSGFVGPAVNSIMSNQVAQNEQGELQGINASVASIGAFIGPLLMTQSFAWFTGPSAPVYFPGIAFMLAAVLAGIAFALFVSRTGALNATGQAQHGA